MSPQPVIIGTEDGLLRGSQSGGVRTFRGVPYARAPVGALRFAAPQPPEAWRGVREADHNAAAAPQHGDPGLYPGDPDAMPPVATSEDCLFLNVWAPADPGPHPVLVWLHGGGQILGGTARPVYDGSAFARCGIVCVTVGHRLGALGFLAVDDRTDPSGARCGNWALRDQIAALRWIRRSIAAFGGDPGRITLGGESAGGKCVAALMGSPTAAGLFHAAIVQSGGAETVHDVMQARDIARRWLAHARAEGLDPRTLGVAQILEAQAGLLTDGGARFPFRPVFGGDLLPLRPLAVIRANRTVRHALLVGTSRDEMGPMLADALLAGDWRPGLLSHHAPGAMARIEGEARHLMPGRAPRDLRRILVSAENYGVPALRLADANAAAGAATWAYRFDVPLTRGPLAGSAPHTADLASTWNAPAAHDVRDENGDTRLHRIIAGFVRTHSAPWEAYDAGGRATALLGERTSVGPHPLTGLAPLFEDR